MSITYSLHRFTDVLLLDQAIRVVPQKIRVRKVQQLDAVLITIVIVIVRLSRCPGRVCDALVRGTPRPEILPIDIVTSRPVVEDLETIDGRCSICASLKVFLELLVLLLRIDLEELHVDRSTIGQGVEPCLLEAK